MDGTEEGESIVTLTEAMKYRGLTVWKLAERTGVKTQTAKKWTEPGGTRKITVERLRQGADHRGRRGI